MGSEPFPFDLTMRPIKYVSGTSTQAAISMTAPNPEGGVMLALFLVDNGTLIGKGTQAATGLGKTVLSDACIAFGNGRFMASHYGSREIKKGVLNSKGDLVWATTHMAVGDEIRAISFCNSAFFVTSRKFPEGAGATTFHVERMVIKESGGDQWSAATFLPEAADCGNVVYESKKKIYCCVGRTSKDQPPFSRDQTICSATSTNGTTWQSFNSSPTNTYTTGNLAPLVGAGGTGGIFVTGGYLSGQGSLEGAQVGTAKGQINRSLAGATWIVGELPVPGGAPNHGSFCQGSVFESGTGGGKFVAAVIGSGPGIPAIIALKSTNGTSWTKIREWGDASTGPGYGGMCIVGKSLGKVVTFPGAT